MILFEMDAIQFILEVLEWTKRQFIANDGKFIGIQVTAVGYKNGLC